LPLQNFSASIYEAQVPMEWLMHEGSPTGIKQILEILNMTFTCIFTIELLVNIFAHKLREFLRNPWSVFDVVIVLMSLIVLGPLDFPISMLRALRVVRLFGRLDSSKKILSALSVSLIPMCNAFFIMLVVAMMCESLLLYAARLSTPTPPLYLRRWEKRHQKLARKTCRTPSSRRLAQTPSWASPSSAMWPRPASAPSTGPSAP
jgi:hypothetical protein